MFLCVLGKLSEMQNDFEKALGIGIAAENDVYEWLKNNYAFVQDSRYQTRDKGTGPRLSGLGGSVIIPDFIVYDAFEGKFALDVKFKTSIYPINGKKYFTVDDYKFRDYLRCMQLMNLDKMVFLFVYNNRYYMYKSDENNGVHRFDNTYGKGAYLFEHNEDKITF